MKRVVFIVVLAVVLALTCGLVACNEKETLALPEYELPVLAAVYGQTLADIPLPPGFSWVEDPTTSVGNAGTAVFHLTYTPTDTDTYQTVTDIEIVFPVSQASTTAPSVTVLNATYGQSLADIALPAGFSWENSASTPVGEIGEQLFYATYTPSDTNYKEVTGIPVTVAVAKGTYDMTGITFPDATYTYDGTIKTISIPNPLPDGITVSYQNDSRVNAGSTTATAVFSGDYAHYNEIPSLTATLTITKKDIIITADAAESVYGQELVPLTATAELALGDDPSTVYTLEKQSGLTAGTYEITVTVVPNDNYNVTQTVNGTYTIQKATYDMGGVFFDDGQFTYDGAAKSLFVQNTLPDGVSVEYEGNGKINADTYIVTAHFTGDADNYNLIEDKTATLTILQAEIEGLAFLSQSVTYDGNEHSIEVTGAPQGASVRYSAATTQVNAGTYEVTATVSVNDPNYKEATLSAILNIFPKSIVVEGAVIRSTYGEELLPLTATADLALGDDPASIYTLEKAPGLTAGSYDIIVTLVDNINPNYTVYQVINGTYIIDKATYDMTGVTFEDAAYTYDGNAHAITITGALPDGVRVLYTNNSRVYVGSMVVTAVFVGDYDNYLEISSLSAELTINKAPAFLNTENMVNRYTYDGKSHKVTGLTASGEIIEDFPFSVKVTGEEGEKFTVTVLESENYLSGEFELSLFVDPAPLVIELSDETINYGDPAPKCPYTITGFVNGEDKSVFSAGFFSFAEGYSVGSDAGTYPIVVSSTTAENYTVTYIPATLTVNKVAPTLTVTATSKRNDGSSADVAVESNSDGAVTVLYKVTGAEDSTYTSVEPTGSGNYTVKAVLAESKNYLAATATAEYFITDKEIPTISFAVDPGKTYDGEPMGMPQYVIKNSANENVVGVSVTIEYKKEGESDSAYTTDSPVNAGNYVVRVISAANEDFESAVVTKDFRILSKELDGSSKVTEVHAPLGVLISEVPLPEHWAWQAPFNVRVGDEDYHFATYTGDPNYHAFPNVRIYFDAPLEVYLVNPDMTVGDVFLPTDWTVDATAKLADLSVLETNDDYTTVTLHATGKELNSMGTYDERIFNIKLMKYQPTLTFNGSLDVACGNNGITTVVNVPQKEEDSRLSFGNTPISLTALFGGEAIQGKNGQNVLARFISAADYTGVDQSDSDFSEAHPQLPGNYVCRIKISDKIFRYGAYVDVLFTISKSETLVTFGSQSNTAIVSSNQEDDAPYIFASISPRIEQSRVYSYKSYGADGVLGTEDDGEWTTVKPRQAGKYQIRCDVGETVYTYSATGVAEITLVKGSRSGGMAYIFREDSDVYLGETPEIGVYYQFENGLEYVYEYKPEGAADADYTATLPKKQGIYDVRVTIPETDYFEATYLTTRTTFHMYEPAYFYAGEWMGEDLTFVFAKTSTDSVMCNIYYVFEGKHTILECMTLDYKDFSRDTDVTKVGSSIFFTCYDYELMLELADASSSVKELTLMRLGTPLYVYNALFKFDYLEAPLTLSFNDVDGIRRAFVYNGTYTLTEIAEQGYGLSMGYLCDWYNTVQTDVIYIFSKETGDLWLRVTEDGKTMERVYGEVVYVVQEEVGEKGETTIQTLVFYNLMGVRYALTYPGAYTKETIMTVPAIISEPYTWGYTEGAEYVTCLKDWEDVLYAVGEDGSLTYIGAADGFRGYAYYYGVWDDGSGKDDIYTISVFMHSSDADIIAEPWKDGVPAKPVTFLEYKELSSHGFDSEYMGDRIFENSEVSGNHTEYCLESTGVYLHERTYGQYSLREGEVEEWYVITSPEDVDDAVTRVFWRSGSETYCALAAGRFYDESALRAAFEEADISYSWEVEDGYLYLYSRSYIKASADKKELEMVFSVDGHTLAEVPLGEYDYVFCQNTGDEDAPYWTTYLFYTFGKEKCAFRFRNKLPEQITGYNTINELLLKGSSMEWSEDAEYVYAEVFYDLLLLAKDKDGNLTEEAPTVEYLFVHEDDDETVAYLMYGKKGVAYVYDGIYSTAKALEEHGVNEYEYTLGDWERVTDGTDTYIFRTQKDTLTVRKVLEDNGTVTFESSMVIYGARLDYVNQIYSDGYYNGTFIFMDLGGRTIVYFANYDAPLTPDNEATNNCGYSYVLGYGKPDEARGIIQICAADGRVVYEYDPINGTISDDEYIPLIPRYYAIAGKGEYILFSETAEGERYVSFMLGNADSLEGVAALTKDMGMFYNWMYGDAEHTFIVLGDSRMFVVPLLGGMLVGFAD